jgi:tetratricopeptide (TPR) repeat protein
VYLCTQFVAILHYLRLCFWPHPLVLDYGHHLQSGWLMAVCGVLLGMLVMATLVALWRWPKVGFLGAWLLAILAPTSSVVPVVDPIFEHRMYLPLAAVVILVVFAGDAGGGSLVRWEWLPRRWANVLGGSMVAAAGLTLGILTFQRNADYQSDLSIWRDTVGKVPNNSRAHNNLGAVLARRGRIDEAMAHYQRALEIKPDYADAHNNLGAVLTRRGRIDEAIAHYRRALEIKPDYAEAHYNFGITLRGRGRIDEAIDHYQRALEIKPDYADAHNNLGLALAGRGRIDEAITHYRKALEIKPDYAEAHINLGAALARRGRIDEAIAHFQKALEIKPDYAEAHINLGIGLARCGRIDEAIEHYRKALVLAQRQSNTALAEALQARLRAYETGTPRRQPPRPSEH